VLLLDDPAAVIERNLSSASNCTCVSMQPFWTLVTGSGSACGLDRFERIYRPFPLRSSAPCPVVT
jgi:hypothetical protein